MAMKAQGRSKDDIIYRSTLGIYGGIFGCILNVLLVIGEIYVSAAPVGSPSSAANFFEYCMSIPIMIAVYIGHRIYRRDWRHWYIKRMDIDLDSGHSLEDFEATKLERDEDKKYVSSKPLYYRIYRFFC
ncbi:CPS_HP_G0109370.mRNA.1.CDS.1 [Saccharomyces cerevisiae]|nr:CPS_HP_G0057810.mRNA.1.CDS.1 [Saccharomyces cerevisiae]CAI4991853.1 CPS_HP_G0068930.mRNA.1.CDS.1 [Saccharomyces cerevisiae]CAI5047181.1 CPS_HP_G0109370.mRNA.1.CDS.1 [Saccharomyces cerevisiae]CAI6796918.1 CPS_HP_G0057810.mRNA.1.CDS.1 [Saccharomyces cerevisiae]CAI6867712.1 CPS_HP_G0068930.mRNA.1.CDS.1 [Saccharomyces cerevisiae]